MTTDTEPQPVLVELGLAVLCPHCRELRKALVQLKSHAVRCTELEGQMYNSEPPGMLHVSLSSLQVKCSECLDTCVLPTAKGQRLLAFFRAFADGAKVGRLDVIDNVPF